MSWLPETIYHHGSRGTAALRPLRGAVDGLWVSRGTGREVLIAWTRLGSGAYTLTADAGQPEPAVTSASTAAEVAGVWPLASGVRRTRACVFWHWRHITPPAHTTIWAGHV